MKSVQIRSFLCSIFSCIQTNSVQIQENTDQKKLRIWTLFAHWKYWLSLYGSNSQKNFVNNLFCANCYPYEKKLKESIFHVSGRQRAKIVRPVDVLNVNDFLHAVVFFRCCKLNCNLWNKNIFFNFKLNNITIWTEREC